MIFLPMPFLHAFSLIIYLARVKHYPFDLGHQCCYSGPPVFFLLLPVKKKIIECLYHSPKV